MALSYNHTPWKAELFACLINSTLNWLLKYPSCSCNDCQLKLHSLYCLIFTYSVRIHLFSPTTLSLPNCAFPSPRTHPCSHLHWAHCLQDFWKWIIQGRASLFQAINQKKQKEQLNYCLLEDRTIETRVSLIPLCAEGKFHIYSSLLF